MDVLGEVDSVEAPPNEVVVQVIDKELGKGDQIDVEMIDSKLKMNKDEFWQL